MRALLYTTCIMALAACQNTSNTLPSADRSTAQVDPRFALCGVGSSFEVSGEVAAELSSIYDGDASVSGNRREQADNLLTEAARSGALSGEDLLRAQENYYQCLENERSGSVSRSVPDFPSFTGELSLTNIEGDLVGGTYSNDNQNFVQFLEAHLGEVVFIDIVVGAEVALRRQEIVAEACGEAGSKFSMYGVEDTEIQLPLEGSADQPDTIVCSYPPFKFTNPIVRSRGVGTGTTYYDFDGFYRVSEGAGRWLNYELEGMPADVDTWARQTNSG